MIINYEELCTFDTLWRSYLNARRGKRRKNRTADFEFHAVEELLILSKSLLHGEYQPDPLDAFLIKEPKERLIQAPSFRDKVIQRDLSDNAIYGELSRSFTLNTYAAQYGKGTYFGLDMLEQHMRTHFLRRKGADEAARRAAGLPYRPIEKWDYAKGAVIKGDIRHFFQSIDHEKLKAALALRFPDVRLRLLMYKYIDMVEGLALGHQTSHIYAVFFVCSIMHFVSEKLHLPLSGMYADDWYAICPDMETAREALPLIREEFAELGLELNNKTNIFPLQNGIDFCGFHTYLTQTGKVIRKLRYSSIKRMKRRIRLWEKQYAAGEITREAIMRSYQSWEAHAKHGNTRQLREDMRDRLLAALSRAEERRGAVCRQPAVVPPRTAPGENERSVECYGKAAFFHSNRQPGQAERKRPGQEIYQAGQRSLRSRDRRNADPQGYVQ